MELPSGRDHVWQADVGTDVCPWLADHMVGGQPILPAAAFAEIALAAGSEAFGVPADAVVVRRLEVEQMLPLRRPHADHDAADSRCRRRGPRGNLLAPGQHRLAPARRRQSPICRNGIAAGPAPAIVESSGTEVSPADFYAALRRTGQHHGPAFAALTRIVRLARRFGGNRDHRSRGGAPASRTSGSTRSCSMRHCRAWRPRCPTERSAEAAEVSYLPVSFETIRVFGEVGRHARCHAEVVDLDEAGAGKLGRVTLTDDAGNRPPRSPASTCGASNAGRCHCRLEQKIFDTEWVPSPPAAERRPGSPGSWLVLADEPDAALMANEFATRWRSPARRVVTADLADEPAVRAAFADTGADAERPPVGVVVFVGTVAATGPGAMPVDRARDSVWAIASTVRAVVGGWHGRSPRLWLVTRGGLVGQRRAGRSRGRRPQGAHPSPRLRASRPARHAGRPGRRASGALADLMAELGSSGSDDVIAWRSGAHGTSSGSRGPTWVTPHHRPVVRDGGAYIVTGGLGGLGLVVARWLVDSGAGRVVLNGRSATLRRSAHSPRRTGGRAEIAVVTGDIAEPGSGRTAGGRRRGDRTRSCAASSTGRR